MSVIPIMSLSVIVLKILKKQRCNSNSTATYLYKTKVMILAKGSNMISYMYVQQIKFQSVIVMLINTWNRLPALEQQEVSHAALNKKSCQGQGANL